MSDADRSHLSASLKEFLAELEDLLEAIGNDLTSLEEIQGGEGEDPDLINSLFRSFHTIKGLAGMLSLRPVNELAHSLEDLLDAARLGKVEVNEDLLEILNRGVEFLNLHAKNLINGEQVPSQAAFLQKVEKLLESAQDSGGGGIGGIVNLDKEILKTLTEYEEHRLRENIKANKKLYLIHRTFPLTEFDGLLNELTVLLKGEGEVISTLPSSSLEDPTAISFDLIWATLLDPDEVGRRLSIGEKEFTIIRYEVPGEPREKEVPTSSLRSISDTVRVDIRRLNNLMNIVGELVIYKTHLGEISREFSQREGMSAAALNLNKVVKSLERTLNLLQKGVIEARMVPIGQMFSKLHRLVRKLSVDLGKEVEMRISGEETELDKLVIEDMADPLLHLIRNSLDHGIERPEERVRKGKPPKGRIDLSAYQKGNHIVIEIRDDGAGIELEKVRRLAEAKGLLDPLLDYDRSQVFAVLFHPGFSTSDKVTDVSGRGVGMDVVKSNVSRLRGMIDLESEEGQGTRVVITLPMTLAIIQALMVRVSGETFAVPIGSVLESVKIQRGSILKVENKEVIRLREGILPLLRIDRFFGMENGGGRKAEEKSRFLYVVVVGLAEKRLGLVVDSLRGQQEIVIKTLGDLLKPVRGVAGATELGDRRAILVLDVAGLIQEVTHAA
jgi:two-component system chemotaxis sensor kinase CheA